MEIIPLTSDYEMKPFDCGDAELKYRLRQECGYSTFRFLTVDAYQGVVPFYERNGFKRLTSTEEGDRTCGMYFDMKTLDV